MVILFILAVSIGKKRNKKCLIESPEILTVRVLSLPENNFNQILSL